MPKLFLAGLLTLVAALGSGNIHAQAMPADEASLMRATDGTPLELLPGQVLSVWESGGVVKALVLEDPSRMTIWEADDTSHFRPKTEPSSASFCYSIYMQCIQDGYDFCRCEYDFCTCGTSDPTSLCLCYDSYCGCSSSCVPITCPL